MKAMLMNTQKVHVLKIEKGDELLSGIVNYVKNNNIVAGFITGIGALEKGDIAYFDVVEKKYLSLSFTEVELLSCTGNISINKDSNEPTIHLHIIVGDREGKTVGGHLISATISVTAEVYIVETRPIIYRIKDAETGLYLLNPKN